MLPFQQTSQSRQRLQELDWWKRPTRYTPPNQDLWGGLKHVHAPRKLVLVYSRHICHDDDSEFCSGKYWFR